MSIDLAQHRALSKTPWRWRKGLRQVDLPASALRVGLALTDEFLNASSGRCFPSLEAIAEACAMPLRSARNGIDALRKAGLIQSQKTKFNGSLTYFLALPAHLRSDQNQSVREDDEATKSGHTKGPKSDARSDQNWAHEVTNSGHLTSEDNLSIEPSNITPDELVPLQSGGGAFGSPSDDSPVGRIPPLVSAPPLAPDFVGIGQEPPINDEKAMQAWLRKNCVDRSQLSWALALLAQGTLTAEKARSLAA
ncbi:helix-turn-helix domain-containing protein [Rhizobium herbae]|uniref:Helix-turn-helix domain-containing protein n=1 Tax=Rhizobium herbae TaxID=508661 RepID=A0ABS4EFY7_9HYPH|nr:hypothetical protein [Rhizobium herbae]